MNQFNKTVIGLLGVVTATLATQTALAAGFYLTEVGTPGSLGTAGTANPTNTAGADSAWTNPAGMTGLDKDQILAGMTLVLPKMEFDPSGATTASGDDGGNAGIVSPIPSFFYVKKLNEHARFGFSLTAPLGGGVDYGRDFVGRYQTISAELMGVGITPSFAYRVNDRLSLGAGISIVYTRFDQEIAINNALNPLNPADTPDGRLEIEKADDWGYQPVLGLTYKLSDRALLGVVYRAEADTDLEGDVKFKNWQLLPVVPSVDSIDISWDNPQWLDVGLRYRLSDQNMLFLNGGWQEWSAFSKNVLAFDGGLLNPVAELDRNWENTWYAGIAFAHRIDQSRGYSFGLSYDSSPVDDEDRTLDLPVDETWKLSAAYAWTGKKKLDFAVGATLMLVGDTEIDQTLQGERVAGEFDSNTLLFLGATLRYIF